MSNLSRRRLTSRNHAISQGSWIFLLCHQYFSNHTKNKLVFTVSMHDVKGQISWHLINLFIIPSKAYVHRERPLKLDCCLVPHAPSASINQVWSLNQFYSVDFSQPRIRVKKCVFNKRTIKVCVSCSWRGPGTSAPGTPDSVLVSL